MSGYFYFSVALLAVCVNVCAQSSDFDFKAELKLNYRDSDDVEFPTQFPFGPDGGPNGEPNRTIGSVDPGSHFEVSNISFFMNWQLSDDWKLLTKVDAIDLYDRNPTSSDNKVDLDRFILRYGNKHTQGNLPESADFYFQLGKFGKLERQEDRKLESYGLAATAFNFLEDSGLEAGVDFSNGIYFKASYTTGNPLFLRDPNALAGDNGAGSDTELNNGIVIFYDAEVEDFNLSDHPETGLAAGYRWLSENGSNRFNLMFYSYERELALRETLNGSDWGADLAALTSPNGESLPFEAGNIDKTESGLNIWWYSEFTSLFVQKVKQEYAGLKREGSEAEFALVIPGISAIGIKRFVPAVRYSDLDIQHGGNALFRSPAVFWDWEKTDFGVNVEFSENIKLVFEHSKTEFERAGTIENNDESRITFIWRYD